MHFEFLPDGESIRILSGESWQDKHGVWWTVSPGLVCDGASIPRFLWPLIGSPFVGKHRKAAIYHDGYYKEHLGRTRKEVDRMFYEKMREDGVGWFKAKTMYYGVRCFGWKYWGE